MSAMAIIIGAVVFVGLVSWGACVWFIIPWEKTKLRIIEELRRSFPEKVDVSVRRSVGLIALVKFGGEYRRHAVCGALYFAADSEFRLYLKISSREPLDHSGISVPSEQLKYLTLTATGIQYDGPVKAGEFSLWFPALLSDVYGYLLAAEADEQRKA